VAGILLNKQNGNPLLIEHDNKLEGSFTMSGASP
jgi:hypothetical protein